MIRQSWVAAPQNDGPEGVVGEIAGLNCRSFAFSQDDTFVGGLVLRGFDLV